MIEGDIPILRKRALTACIVPQRIDGGPEGIFKWRHEDEGKSNAKGGESHGMYNAVIRVGIALIRKI